MLEWSNKSFRTQHVWKGPHPHKPRIQCFNRGRGAKGSSFKFSCLKASLKKESHSTEAVYFRKHSDNWPVLLYTQARHKPAGARAGSTRPLDLLSKDIRAQGPVRGCPKAPLQLLHWDTVQRVWQLIFSFEIRIHAGYFKLGLKQGSGRGVRYGSSGLWVLLFVCLSFRNGGGNVMKTLTGGKGLEISDFWERERLVRTGRDVRGRPEPQAFRQSWVGRWRLVFVLAFASQKGTLFALSC